MLQRFLSPGLPAEARLLPYAGLLPAAFAAAAWFGAGGALVTLIAGLPIAAWGIAALVALFLVRQPWAQVRQLPLPHTPAKV